MNGPWTFPNEATPPGSGPYYVARFAAPERRDEIAAWFAWFQLLDRAAQQSRDPGVTRLKLDWWHEEVNRIPDASARHPLALALAPVVRADWQAEQMHRLLDATEAQVRGGSPPDLEALKHQCREEQAGRLHLLANAVSDCAEQVAVYIGIVARLQRLPLDLRRYHLSLPVAQEIDAETLIENARLGRFGTELLEVAERTLPADIAQLATEPRALLAQHRRIARKLAAEHFPTRRLVSPTPIALLWSAWRRR
ncbi:MAG: hypothetical protein D6720_06355 [Gammaproteobacteria bacterium]|nr:MAG: hypothetical protein D6720_06355 [Gammaproteobacteria bacterium]